MAEHQQDHLLHIFQAVWKRRILIITVTFVVAVLAAIISLLMPNYYQSVAVIHPVSPSLSSPGQIFGTSATDQKYFGDKEDVDRILTLAESRAVTDHLIQTFSLYDHYGIDPNREKAPLRISKRINKLYKVQKTRLGNVSLSVEDKDPQIAAAMVNEAHRFINALNQELIRTNMNQMLIAFEANLSDQNSIIRSMTDTLIMLRNQYGVYDVSAQSELIATIIGEAEAAIQNAEIELEYLRNFPGARRDSIAKYERILRINRNLLNAYTGTSEGRVSALMHFSEGVGRIRVLEEQLENLAMESSRNLERYNRLRSAQAADIPGIIVLSEGELPLEKLRPKRSLIVIGAAFAAFIFSILGIATAQAGKEYAWDELLRDPAKKA